jgi:hypothetical protein
MFGLTKSLGIVREYYSKLKKRLVADVILCSINFDITSLSCNDLKTILLAVKPYKFGSVFPYHGLFVTAAC